MAPPGTRRGRSVQMPWELVGTSFRIESRNIPGRSQPDTATSHQPRRSSRLAELLKKRSSVTQLLSSNESLLKDDAEGTKSLQRPGNSKPAGRQTRKKISVQQAQLGKEAQVRTQAQERQEAQKRTEIQEKEAQEKREVKERKQAQEQKRARVRKRSQIAQEELHAEKSSSREQGATGRYSTRREQSGWERKDPPSAPPPAFAQARRPFAPILAEEDTEGAASSRLSRAALRQLRRETAYEPLPREILQYKAALSNDEMTKSGSKGNGNAEKSEKGKAVTVYSQTFLDDLTERGVLDQQFKKGSREFNRPSNYEEIRAAIVRDRPNDVPSEKDYETFHKTLSEASNEAGQKDVFALFFGVPISLEDPHRKSTDERWLKHIPVTSRGARKDGRQKPHPDAAEGLQALQIPKWIRKRLQGYAVPRSRFAFPNFVVELKRDKSMFTGHVQNRHCGAVAMQGFVEYFVRLEEGVGAWDTARVGSIEFNGDIFVGNVHWATRSKKNPMSRKYHMTRALCRFTYGLSYEDFKVAHKEARNFREYFLKERELFQQRCKSLPRPPGVPPTSSSEEDEASEDENEETGEDEESDQEIPDGIDESEDEASEYNRLPDDQKRASQPSKFLRRRSPPQKRTRRGGGRPSKKSKPGSRTQNVEEDEPTGLTQETAVCGLE